MYKQNMYKKTCIKNVEKKKVKKITVFSLIF